jgi:hypothetical protein|nr:MAG TPA: hypothetical protein [Caudoviricetes sp.]
MSLTELLLLMKDKINSEDSKDNSGEDDDEQCIHNQLK